MTKMANTFTNDATFCVVRLKMLFTCHLYQGSV